MELIPLLIVLLSAAGHAMWNFFAKQSAHKLAFIWGLYALGAVFYLPLYLAQGLDAHLGTAAWACILASAAAKAVYVIFLAEALRTCDLSLAYPLSRIAPAIVPFWAVAFLGESLSLLGAVGIAVVCASILVIHLQGASIEHMLKVHHSFLTRGTVFALLAAVMVSAYSIIDKLAMSRYAKPIAFNYVHWVVTVFLLAPYVLRRAGVADVVALFRSEWWPLAISGFLDFGAYVLVLYVMETDKVSYIVAARQTSQIMAILLGTLLLGERCGGIRLFAGGLILGGVTLIAMAR
ncbi:MAG: hypothetical protein FJ291_04320 [Planctomycetes bacterium]|nr:hypothetical protein [Planctomycetota bacterium]